MLITEITMLITEITMLITEITMLIAGINAPIGGICEIYSYLTIKRHSLLEYLLLQL